MSLKALSSHYNNQGYISELSSKCLRKVNPPPKGRLLLARKVSKMSLEELQAIPEIARIKLVREAFQEKLMESQKPRAHQGFQKNVAPFKNHLEGFIDVNTQAFKALNSQIKEQVNHELLNIQYNLDDSTAVAQKRARKLNPDDEAACQKAVNESIMLRAKQVLTETKHQPIEVPKARRPKPILNAEVKKLADFVGISKALHLKLFLDSSRKLSSKLSEEISTDLGSKLPQISNLSEHRRHLSHPGPKADHSNTGNQQHLASVRSKPPHKKYESSVFSTLSRRLSRPRIAIPRVKANSQSQFSQEQSEFYLMSIPKEYHSVLEIQSPPQYHSEFEQKLEFEPPPEAPNKEMSWLAANWSNRAHGEPILDSPDLVSAPKADDRFLMENNSFLDEQHAAQPESPSGPQKSPGRPKQKPKQVVSSLRRYMASGDAHFQDYLAKHKHPSFGNAMDDLQHKIEGFHLWKNAQDKQVLETACKVGNHLKRLKKELSNQHNLEQLGRRADNLNGIKSLISKEQQQDGQSVVFRKKKRRLSLKAKLLQAVT